MELKFRAWDTKRNNMLYYNSFHEFCGQYYAYCNQFLPLQYTGLKDKNGKEIYEGDIIIDYDKQHSGYNIPLEVIITPYNTTTKEESLGYRAWERYEVIGNIYENPDLINN